MKGIKDTIREFIHIDLFPPRTGTDIVSSNAKIVLYGLFALVGFAILTYAITVTGPNYNPNDANIKNKSVPLNDSQRLEQLEQLEKINGVYIAAISGAVALGGTLIAQLWGRG